MNEFIAFQYFVRHFWPTIRIRVNLPATQGIAKFLLVCPAWLEFPSGLT